MARDMNQSSQKRQLVALVKLSLNVSNLSLVIRLNPPKSYEPSLFLFSFAIISSVLFYIRKGTQCFHQTEKELVHA